jgi:putative ATP-binding cassette transporter
MVEHLSRAAQRAKYRIDKVLFRRIWRLSRPYWLRAGALPAWAALAATVVAAVLTAGATAWASYRMKDFTDALIAGHRDSFIHNLLLFIALHAAAMLLAQPLNAAISNWLSWDWRGWLTRHLVTEYLDHRNYYDIALHGDLDNPDQRLQESTTLFVKTVLALPTTLLGQVGTILAGIAVIVALDRNLALAACALGAAQIITSYLSVIPFVRLNSEMLVAEADLRFSLVRVREHAEAIAFYHGERAERGHIFRRIALAVRRQLNMGYYEVFQTRVLPQIFNLGWVLLPFLVLGPKVLSGQLTYGSVAQATVLAAQIMMSVMMLAAFVSEIGRAAPQTIRLAEIQERLDSLRAGREAQDGPRIAVIRHGEAIRLTDLTIDTPDGGQRLLHGLTLSVEPGTNLAILGQTGVGKSSLLRVMAGLWTRGTGQLEMPVPAECLFLPQRPYMAATDLRSQLHYPHNVPVTDEALQDILATVNLSHLLTLHGDLSTVRHWDRILSLGEQQRIAFARILVSRPRFVFLDEATSAVDHATETRLYNLLRETGATFVSIGHRLTILDHHTHILTLQAGGDWTLEPHCRAAETELMEKL